MKNLYSKIFFRLDDVAPNMNWENFELVSTLFKRFNIKPLIAVIPDVQDKKLTNYPLKENFWLIMKGLCDIGWIIAQHGYKHLAGGDGGILRIHKNGEFGGLGLKEQEAMISSGKKIMESQDLFSDIFVAPRHSFDKNTLKALKKNNFHFISDGIALWPFEKWGLIWLPQILWRPRKGMIGLVTVALHVNTMSRDDLRKLEEFVEKNRGKIGNFSELMEWHDRSGILQKFFTKIINWPFKIFWYIIFSLKYGVSR